MEVVLIYVYGYIVRIYITSNFTTEKGDSLGSNPNNRRIYPIDIDPTDIHLIICGNYHFNHFIN